MSEHHPYHLDPKKQLSVVTNWLNSQSDTTIQPVISIDISGYPTVEPLGAWGAGLGPAVPGPRGPWAVVAQVLQGPRGHGNSVSRNMFTKKTNNHPGKELLIYLVQAIWVMPRDTFLKSDT